MIVKRGALIVTGSQGTGKTTYLQGIAERLMSLRLKVDIISKTHCASARTGGRTADYWIRRHIINGDCSADSIWTDEISQLDIELITALNRLTYTNVKFLISRDFNQFGPLGNSFRGPPIAEDAFEHSNLLHRMAGGNRLTLTECRRSKAELFNLYTRIIPGGDPHDQPLEAVNLARQQFTYDGICDLNLTPSHRKRVVINRRVNLYKKPSDAVFLPCPKLKRLSQNAPQEVLWKALELLGCVPIEKYGLWNGVTYVAEQIAESLVHFEGGISLTKEDTIQMMRLSHVMTYASTQGRETEGTLRLNVCNSPHMTHKHLYAALSRAKLASHIRVQ